MKKIKLIIEGMHCNSCSTVIENEFEDRGIKAKVNFASEKAEIEFDKSKISEEEIIELIKKIGYGAKK